MIMPTTPRRKPNARSAQLDARVGELQMLATFERVVLPMPIDMILWYEDQGYIIDFESGRAVPLAEVEL